MSTQKNLTMNQNPSPFRCGQIAIIGRPNVGKSTLLNHLIGQKLSITSRKPQTTRHRILGIKTDQQAQLIYVDTPGLHQTVSSALNRSMNRAANSAIFEVNLILFVVDGLHWTQDDDWIWKKMNRAEVPIILVVNKIDKIPDKKKLLPYLHSLNEKFTFAQIFPMCARKRSDVEKLEKVLIHYLPEAPAQFPEDQITNLSEAFFAAEIIREKLMRHLGQELPYVTTVDIEQFKQDGKMLRIAGVIYVDKAGQKPIVIGAQGQRLKQIGQEARLDMQNLFGRKVFLELWVKIKRGWMDDKNKFVKL